MPESHPMIRPIFATRMVRVALAPLVTAATVLVAGCGEIVAMSDAWSRGQIDLVRAFTGGSRNPDWPYLDASDLTSQVCGSEARCVQAVGNEYLTLLKFADVDAARDYAAILGSDGVQIDPLVVDFSDSEASPEVRREIVDSLSSINASSPD